MLNDLLVDCFSKYGCDDGEYSFAEELAEHLESALPRWRVSVMLGTTHNQRVHTLYDPSGKEYSLNNIKMSEFKKLPIEVQEALRSFLPRYEEILEEVEEEFFE